jgi:tetrapyrrole methylase family protein/MazG family protein
MDNSMEEVLREFKALLETVKTLREPGGCPWDREQTPASLKENLIEESYECIEAITEEDDEHVNEELGDLYLLVTMIGYMYEQEEKFSIANVLHRITEKLHRRHPHVFGKQTIDDSDEVIKQWDSIKRNVEGQGKGESILSTIPKTYPPLERALKMQKKARKVGFDWQKIDNVWEKLDEEIGELKEVADTGNMEETTREFGDLLFTLVNLARFMGINPSTALHLTNNKFEKRFSYVENAMYANGRELSGEHFEEMDQLWEESKSEIDRS